MLYVEMTFVKSYKSETPENCYCQNWSYELPLLLRLFIDQKLHLNIYQFQHATVKVLVPLLDSRDLYCQAPALNLFHLSLPSNFESI